MQTTDDLDAAYAASKARVEAWERGDAVARPSPKRYVLGFEWPSVAARATFPGTQLPYQERTFTTDRGVIARVVSIEAVYSVRGTLVGSGANAIVVVPPARRSTVFTFDAKIRDNGTNRAWSNGWIPGSLFATGDRNGLTFASALGVLPGGSELTVAISALYRAAVPTVIGFSAINAHFLEMSFVCEQVKV